ncbi:MAG: nitrogen fixation protein NifQ [Methylocystis sp.]
MTALAPLENTGCDAAALDSDDAFLAHVFLCLIEVGVATGDGKSLGATLGVHGQALREIVQRYAPDEVPRLACETQPAKIDFDEEEEQLRLLFQRYRIDDSRETDWLIDMLARRSMSANHLWQDLGLHSRTELNRLIASRFPDIFARNAHNMKWKKFFFRCLCELEGFTLCAAPSCGECSDYHSCFGEEAGAALARGAAKDVSARVGVSANNRQSALSAR